jgi:very-short-patch-repair endonuclease
MPPAQREGFAARPPGPAEPRILPGPDREIARLAGRRRGLVTRKELLALGLSSSAIGRRVSAGRLHPIHAGVYAVGHRVLPELGREQAALLACGWGAVLSHHSAAAVWRLLAPDGAVHVTVPRRGEAAGIRLHESAVLPREEVRVREGLPVTSVARTLLDLAGTDGRAFGRALDEALVRRLVVRGELEAVLASRRRGAARLRAAIDAEPRPTRSQLERRSLALVARAGLPRPQTNAHVEGWEVDAVWPRERLIAELDGFAVHSTRRAFEADRLRDAEHQAAGYRTLRLTHRELAERPERVAARLAAALSRAP